MSLFTRLADIMAANFNALLDRAENPERMLAQIIREMEETLAAARQQGATVVAGERRIWHELERTRGNAAARKTRARLALKHEREDLARRALARHFEQLDLAQCLEAQHAAARQNSAEVQTTVETLEDRLEQARRQLRLLAAHQQAVQVQAQMSAAAGGGHVRSPFARFARLENRLAELHDDLLVHAVIASPRQQLESELSRLETDSRVNCALTELKNSQKRPETGA